MIFSQKHISFLFLFLSGLFFGFYFSELSSSKDESILSSFPSFSSWIEEKIWQDIYDSKKIQEAKWMIYDEYYHFTEKTKEEVENGFISALVASLGDKHSTYFPPKDAEEFSDTLRGDFEWIWAVIDENPKWVKIQKVLENSPAEKWGLKNGDIIIKSNSISLVGLSAEDAVKKIRWPKWSTVQIIYLRWESNEEFTVDIKRDRVLIPSTRQQIFTGSIGYLEVGYFGEHTIDEFRKSLKSLTDSGATGIILDFRNNPGWYLDSAVDILSTLISGDSIAVITRENDPKKNETLYTKTTAFTNTWVPLVFLVNGLSASASEILAGALQDYGRAIVVWEKTYGKWSVQSPFVMSDGSILKLTIWRWYTPKDRGIDGMGITPDIIISLKDEDYKNIYDRQLEWAKKLMEALIQNNGDVKSTIEQRKKDTF